MLAAGMIALAGCGSGQVPRYATFAELSDAAVKRIAQDGVITSTSEDSITVNGRVLSSSTSTGGVRLGPDGPSQHDRSTGQQNGMPFENEIIVRPDGAWVLLPEKYRAADGKRFLKLDPDATDPVSLFYAPLVRSERETGTRIYCFSQLGTAEVTSAEPAMLDGVPVMHYVITIDLTQGTTQPLQTQQLRNNGLTSMQAAMDVDAQDRILTCTADQDFPGGLGRLHSDQRFRFGGPVDVEPPPADQVTTTPPGITG